MERWRHLVSRSLRVAAVGVAGLLLLADLGMGGWIVAGSGALVVTAALLDRDLRARVLAAVSVSAAATVITTATPSPGVTTFGLAEAAGLGLLLVLATRLLALRSARWAVPALALAVLVLPLRLGGEGASARAGVTVFLAICVAMAVALGGGLLRAQDSERERQLHHVRSDERLSLARDLHDSVAHHVTGIVVRAQAAQVVAGEHPDEALAALTAIERAGTATLTSMRRLVGVLREDEGARSTPPGLAQIRDLVAGFSAGAARATLSASPAAAGTPLPDEVGTAAHRVVQEALTNARRHAQAPSRITAALDVVDGALLVEVRDDGRRAAAGPSGGFGLVGLRERVAALGGRLEAGPGADGGWCVRATLPLEAPR